MVDRELLNIWVPVMVPIILKPERSSPCMEADFQNSPGKQGFISNTKFDIDE